MKLRPTPWERFQVPILEILVLRGGEAHKDVVREYVFSTMRGVLNELDMEDKDISGGYTEPKWWHRTRDAADKMRQGKDPMLERTGVRNLWRVSDAGRQFLAEYQARNRAANDFGLPDELPPGMAFEEGSVRRIEVNRYERDPQARMACIAAHGDTCCICGFNFGVVYGDEAEGYIHVHHTRPLAEAGGGRTVDPVEDLRPVCPNCHAVLHLNGRCRTIDEMRQLVSNRRKAEPELEHHRPR